MIEIVEALRELELPPLLWRHRWKEYRERFGMPLSYGTLANEDSRGTGPRSGKLGRMVFYKREDFLQWLAERYNGQAP